MNQTNPRPSVPRSVPERSGADIRVLNNGAIIPDDGTKSNVAYVPKTREDARGRFEKLTCQRKYAIMLCGQFRIRAVVFVVKRVDSNNRGDYSGYP